MFNFGIMESLLSVLGVIWLIVTGALWIWHLWRNRNLLPILNHTNAAVSIMEMPFLSVIICFRNEAKNLQTLIPYWADQDYPAFELILVNDHSEDESLAIVQKFQTQYSHLKLVSVNPQSGTGKKAALAQGISTASSDFLVFTDADCKPASQSWLKGIGLSLSTHDVVLGYGPLNGKGFTSLLADYETVATALRYWSYASRGHIYMGVGRNLGYRKSAMQADKALAKHRDLLSGDDDLTLNESSKGLSVYCLTEPNTFMHSMAPKTIGEWWHQKGRHYSTAWRYNSKLKIALGLEGFLQLYTLLAIPAAILTLEYYFWLPLLVGRWFFSQYPKTEHLALLKQPRAAKFWPFFEAFWALSTAILHFRNLLLGPPKKW
jgi:glycosyltransferase involved in cell wall biosynthesis